MKNEPQALQLIPIAQAFFVTFLWSTSWILIKPVLSDIPPITFAGLRYFVGFLVLLVFWVFRGGLAKMRELTRRDWVWLIGYGVIFYALTQAAGFIAIGYIPAATFSLVLNFSAVIVALLGMLFLKEKLSVVQWVGVGVFLIGLIVYFWPLLIPAEQWFGLLMAAAGMVLVSISATMGRFLNREGRLDVLTITVISMGIGSVLMLGVGLVIEPAPVLNASNWLVIGILAVVNTAFAFTLWSHTQRSLSAMQSNIINNTMLVQMAFLAWWFLDEVPTGINWVGMFIVLAGVVLVNWPGKTEA